MLCSSPRSFVRLCRSRLPVKCRDSVMRWARTCVRERGRDTKGGDGRCIYLRVTGDLGL